MEGKFARWTSNAEGVTYSRGEVLEVETTALAAYAFLRAGTRQDAAHKALAWLLDRKDPNGTWHSTQATVLAMRALLAGTGPTGAVEGDAHVTIAANGKLAQELVITPETSDVFRLVSLRELLVEGRNSVALEAAGGAELAFQVVATHYLPWRDREIEPRKKMAIDVAYDTAALKTDDLLTCRVSVRYNGEDEARMTIVDLGVPPGFELLPDAFDELRATGRIERYSIAGRQVILYLRELEARKPFGFSYQLRARYPVKVKTPPSQVYQYYEPEVRDETAPAEIVVR